MQQQWQPLFALGIPLLAICSIGSAVEFCWAAGEAVLVPYLTKHGVRRWVVSTIYLANPTLGLWVQPRLGAWSDRINRRVPFVIALSLVALVGIVTLISALPLVRALRPSYLYSEDGDGSSSMPPIAVVMAFLGFGAADICFDCLLIPGRALLDDMTVPAGRSDEANALFTGFQLGGRLLALLVGSSEWTTSGLWGLYKDSTDAHFNACFTVSALFLIASMFAVILFVEDRGSTYGLLPSDSHSDSTGSGVEIEEMVGLHPDEREMLQPTSLSRTDRNYQSNNIQVESVTSGQRSPQHKWLLKPDACMLLYTIQAAGWVGVCAQSFFWTSWRGEVIGCVDLAIQGVVGMATAGLLPHANAYFGTACVWCGSELFFHLLMMSTGLVPINKDGSTPWFSPRIIGAFSGINYAVHATNGLLVAADIVSDQTKRARTIAMVNNALPMGQLITALSGGMIAQYFGGFQYVFVCYGFFGALVTSVIWAYSLRESIFTGDSGNNF